VILSIVWHPRRNPRNTPKKWNPRNVPLTENNLYTESVYFLKIYDACLNALKQNSKGVDIECKDGSKCAIRTHHTYMDSIRNDPISIPTDVSDSAFDTGIRDGVQRVGKWWWGCWNVVILSIVGNILWKPMNTGKKWNPRNVPLTENNLSTESVYFLKIYDACLNASKLVSKSVDIECKDGSKCAIRTHHTYIDSTNTCPISIRTDVSDSALDPGIRDRFIWETKTSWWCC
jgi:hypothetical protein